VLWFKTFHVLTVMAWLAGVFYLPRIFVNYAEARDAGEPTARLIGMGRRLFRFSSILAVFALTFGMILWTVYGIDGRWLQWKLVFVVALVAYHLMCGAMLRRMVLGTLTQGSRFFRVFNEISVLIVLAILILVIVRPFGLA
jgi:putative membrane protein